MNIAIVGATGNVGRIILEVLEKKNFEVENLYLLASQKSQGSNLKFNGREIKVELLDNFDFSKVNLTFFSAGGKISEKFAAKAAKNSLVIDNSSFFRMDPEVPLIVPQVNSNYMEKVPKNIIANPNCSTAQLVIVLKPLHDLFKIKRVIVSTYQSTSGAGKAPMDEMIEQTQAAINNEKITSKNFTKQIAFNAIPHIDSFSEDGYTKEELKMTNETKKILDEKIDVTATCVRVPVKTGHSESINIEFEKSYDLENIVQILDNAPGCKVVNERKDGGYITPLEVENDYTTYISRIRKDNTNAKAINIWVVSDNLLKGAALNTVQIAECLMKKLKY